MYTITSPRDVDRLFREGVRAARHSIVVLSASANGSRDLNEGRVIFVAGKKLGGAVLRNRCKRVLRAACRRNGGPWSGYDVALIARATTAVTDPAKLDADLLSALRQLKVIT